MGFIKKLLNAILPEDPRDGCGYGPFRLPDDHAFTHPCVLHDQEFDSAHKGESTKTRSEVDWDLFYRWVLVAKAANTHDERCKLARDICTYWPLARKFGGLLWDGKASNDDK